MRAMSQKFIEISEYSKIKLPENSNAINLPCKISICGCSMAGKSTLLAELLANRHKFFATEFSMVFLILPQNAIHVHSTFIENLKTSLGSLLQISPGLPNMKNIEFPPNSLIIAEDISEEIQQSPHWLDFFVHHSHHMQVSLIMTQQTYFSKQKFARQMALNTTHLFLLPNALNALELRTLNYRIFPDCNENVLQKAVAFAQSKKHEIEPHLPLYLFFNFHPRNSLPPQFVVKSFIFPRPDLDNAFKAYYFLPSTK